MKNQMYRTILLASLALALLSVGGSWAQGVDQGGGRFLDRIQNDTGLSEQQRDRMRTNLQLCRDLALTDEQLDALFPDGGSHFSGETRLRMQEQVLALAVDGQPYDLLCSKVGEGEMKGAREPDVERAVNRMSEYVRAAHQYMEDAKQDGVAGLDDMRAEQHLQRGIAMNMWRGLERGELDQLRTHARERLRDGSCNLIDLSAAAETATELKESGVRSELAMDLCGDALREGYRAADMRGLGRMTMVAHRNGEPGDDFCIRLRDRVREHANMAEMQQTMMQSGWMGPESMGHGFGGHSPVDDVMGGHHSGMGGHHSGGMDDRHGGHGMP